MRRPWLLALVVVALLVVASWKLADYATVGTAAGTAIHASTDGPGRKSSPTATLPARAQLQSQTFHAYVPTLPNDLPAGPILFSDGFDNPNSGWPIGDDGNI